MVQASTIEDIPGKEKGLGDVVMEQAENAIQKFSPFQRIHQHVCGFHFYAHDMTRQVDPTTFPPLLPPPFPPLCLPVSVVFVR